MGWLSTVVPHSGNRGRPLFIESGSPWENGYSESFHGTLRDELLDREIFFTLREAQVRIERCRQHHNGVRPHTALGYRPPDPPGASLALTCVTIVLDRSGVPVAPPDSAGC